MKSQLNKGKAELTRSNYLKKLQNLQISFTTLPNSAQQVKTPNVSINNNSFKILSQQTTPKTVQENNFFSSRDQDVNELKKQHVRTQSQIEGLLLRTQLVETARQRTASTFIKKPKAEVKPAKQMNQEDELRKQEKQKKMQLMQQVEMEKKEKEKLNQQRESTPKINSLTSILSKKSNAAKYKLLKVSLNVIEKSKEKNQLESVGEDFQQLSQNTKIREKQTDTIFKISTIITALMFQRLHSKITSPKLARLVAKHYLSLINYRKIEERLLALTSNPSMKYIQNVLHEDDVLSNAIKVAQVREIQRRLNEGLSQRRKASKIIFQKKSSRELRAEDIFSEKVLKRVRFIQMCFRMKVFKVNKRTIASSKPIEKARKSTKVRAFKRRLGDIIFMSENVPVFQLQQEKKEQEDKEKEKEKLQLEAKKENLGVFGMLWKAQNKFKNFCRHPGLKIPSKTCDDWVKYIQTLYYPSFRYISVFYRNIVVWSVSYYDVTYDKSCIALFFKGEGRQQYHFRLDIPLVTMPDFEVNKNCNTVWPTVKDYMLIYLRQKGQLALLNKDHLPSAKVYKTSFIQGLSLKSRRKLTELDIQSIVETQKIITYLQNNQIVKIKKKIGTTYDLLPQLSETIDSDLIKQYIINLPMIRLILIDILVLEQKLLENKRKLTQDIQNLSKEYVAYIQTNKETLNQILQFRFLHNNSEFFNDQLISKINQQETKKIFIQSCFVDINEILVQSNDALLGQVSKTCQLSIHLCYNGNVVLDKLLLDVDRMRPRYSLHNESTQLFSINTQTLQWLFDTSKFQLQIEALLFEKDKQNTDQYFYQTNLYRRKNERIFQPLSISVFHFEKLALAVKEIMDSSIFDHFEINQILKNLIFERANYSVIINLILNHLITLNFKNRQVTLKAQYQHILSSNLNFIEKMDHHSLYNTTQTYLKYSIYPHEEKDLRKMKETRETQSKFEYHSIFDQQFQQIDQIELKPEYTSKQLEVAQEYNYDQKQIFWSQGVKRFDTFQHPNLVVVRLRDKFIIVIMSQQRVRMINITTLRQPLILDSNNARIFLNSCKYTQQKQYQKLSLYRRLFIILLKENCFLRIRMEKFNCTIRASLPNYSKIKAYLLSDSKELVNYLNRLDFTFTFETINKAKCYANVKVFYLGRQESYYSTKYEQIYKFDGENLFISLQIHEFDSKLKKYILIFNKFDIEQRFEIYNYFSPNLIYQWCQEFVVNLKFDKKFLYKTPFSVMQIIKSYQDIKLASFWIAKRSQKCILNEYQRVHSYDYSLAKQFLSQRYKIFRVIAHYIEKFYVVKQNNQITLLNECMFLQFKNYKLIKVEFVIITIQAHTVLDLVQIIYYFPKSKKRLMTNINLIQIQEMDFSLGMIFQLLNVTEFTTFNDITSQVDEIQRGSLKYRRSSKLNSQVMTKLHIMRQSIDVSQLSFRTGKIKRRQGFVHRLLKLISKQKLSIKPLERMRICAKNGDRKNDKRYLLEIMFWKLMQQQVFQLSVRKEKRQLKSYISLFDRLVELFDNESNKKYRIIGKEYLEKKQTDENIRYNYKVQSECRNLYRDLILEQEIYMTQNLNFGKTPFVIKCNLNEISILEYLCTKQFRSDNGSRGYIEYFLEKKQKQKGIDLFDPAKPILYSASSSYNIYLRYYCLANYQYKDLRINLREIMNQLVTDGLYKSQSNYMNSKINLSDIIEMCHYLTQKIKTQNYLNLARLSQIQINQLPEIQQHIISECDDQLSKETKQKSGDGFVCTQVIRNKKNHSIYQYQLFQTTRKVIINKYEMRQDYFEQKEFTYAQLTQYVHNFTYLIKAKLYYLALKRFSQCYIELQKINQ
ncbi:unnamed protein product (macronuclear) [Paramecium tetraurelia]|uniref:IQ calmodulin-binding motif family protein n=1 Tax=Paramecium tetraurelia TaxID=5888 RepID=A0BBX2_PARTE|nr:uncharacterized protein GSPATT00000474001 [Paramecium tetraurelia]CAK56039.1 unnamed protein product [Paramecium tetraurelia]|eukprot:XP_001423437.1 hypothetical protein (macronuclear) [Paramecium tetraurelia strain d4-2]